MPFYGPRELSVAGDTNYFTIRPFQLIQENEEVVYDTLLAPKTFVAVFSSSTSKDSTAPLAGLLNYVRFRPNDLKKINFLFLLPQLSDSITFNYVESIGLQKIVAKNAFLKNKDFVALKENSFFKKDEKGIAPQITPDANMVLIDSKRRIRGYYNGIFDTDIKRMIEDCDFLEFHDASVEVVNATKIEQRQE